MLADTTLRAVLPRRFLDPMGNVERISRQDIDPVGGPEIPDPQPVESHARELAFEAAGNTARREIFVLLIQRVADQCART